jgi:hypothetical protein
LRLLLAKTTLFQTETGKLYLFRNSQPTQVIGDHSGINDLYSEDDDDSDIWALIDGDPLAKNPQPHHSLLVGPWNVRLIMASSLKSGHKWVEKMYGREILMDLWKPSEIFFAAYVLSLI